MAINFTNKKLVFLIAEMTMPPVSRANLRVYRLARILKKRPDLVVYMLTPSQMPWNRKSKYLEEIFMNQYWGFSDLLYSRVRILVRAWHFLATVVSLVYLNFYCFRHNQQHIQIIHACNPLAGFAAVVTGKLISCSVYIDFCDFYSDIARTDLPLLTGVLQKMERFVLRNATKIFVVSEAMKLYLSQKWKLPAKKIFVVSDGVDTKMFSSKKYSPQIIRRKLSLGFSPVIIFHGDIRYDDGVDILFKAFPLVLKQLPETKLLLLGGGGSYFSHLKKSVSGKPFSSSIIHINWVPHQEVPYYIAAADVGAMPMRPTLNNNTFVSFKLFEYWSMGKPVVITRLKALSRVVENDKTGIVVESENPRELAKALVLLLQNPKLAQKIGRQAKATAQKKFDWDMLMKKEAAYYL